MSVQRSSSRLKNNIVSSSTYQILVMIVPILTTPYVTRIFSVDQMGKYSLSLTIASLFVVFSQFGLPTYGSREIAVSNSDEDKTNVFFQLESIQIIISIIMFLLYNLIFVFFLDYGDSVLFFVQSLLIIANILDISWYYVGIEEIGKIILRNAITKILTTLLIFIVIKDQSQLNLYALINVLGVFLGNLTMIFNSRKYINYTKKKLTFSIKHFVRSFKLLIPVFVSTSYESAEKSILSFSSSVSNVGIYSEAKKIINLAAAVINSAFNALSPRMSYYVSIGKLNELNHYFEKGLIGSNIFSIVVVSGIFSVANDFVGFFYGEGYYLVALVLKVSSIALIVVPITALINRGILIPYGKDKQYSISFIIILISGVIMNFIWDRQLGAIGAASAYTITQFLSFFYVSYISKKVVSLYKILISLFCTILIIIINYFITSHIFSLFLFQSPGISFLIKGIISTISSIILIITVIIILKIMETKKKNL